MNTEQALEKWKMQFPDRKIITEPNPDAEYITISEYIRRRHRIDLKKDAQAAPLYHTSLLAVINRGDFEVLCQGGRMFVDWNTMKGFVFMRYRQMPTTSAVGRKPHHKSKAK